MFNCKKLEIFHKDNKLVDINFKIKESLALVGESGSGKSLTLKSILGLLPNSFKYNFDYDNSFELKRGETITFVPQNPFTSLSPLTKIRKQFLMEKSIAKKNLELVGLKLEFLDRFPSELSGGQLQRVIIAMSLTPNVKLMLLDEPTTALDIDSKTMILNLLKTLQKKFKFKILFVTHDIDSVKSLCEDIAVLNNGIIVESGNLNKILENPQNEYTKKLIEANFKNRGFRE